MHVPFSLPQQTHACSTRIPRFQVMGNGTCGPKFPFTCPCSSERAIDGEPHHVNRSPTHFRSILRSFLLLPPPFFLFFWGGGCSSAWFWLSASHPPTLLHVAFSSTILHLPFLLRGPPRPIPVPHKKRQMYARSAFLPRAKHNLAAGLPPLFFFFCRSLVGKARMRNTTLESPTTPCYRIRSILPASRSFKAARME